MRTFSTGFFTECSVSELISINITYTRIITLLWMIFLVWVLHLFMHLSTEKNAGCFHLAGHYTQHIHEYSYTNICLETYL